MARGFIYDSPSYTAEAQLQRLKRHIAPLLDEILDEDSQKDIGLDDNNNIVINGVPIGDYSLMSSFRVERGSSLVFDYGDKIRDVFFGVPAFEPVTEVMMIQEYCKSNRDIEIIYDGYKKEEYCFPISDEGVEKL